MTPNELIEIFMSKLTEEQRNSLELEWCSMSERAPVKFVEVGPGPYSGKDIVWLSED
jgi:hypothetical protein